MGTRVYTETRFSQVTPIITAALYGSGNLIGGKLSFTNAVRGENPSGLILSARVIDKSKTLGACDLILFSSNPSGTTFTDKSAFDIAAADLNKVVGVISFASTNEYDTTTTRTIYVQGVAVPFYVNAGTPIIGTPDAAATLYGALVARSTPTFASTSDITIELGIALD